MGWTVLGTNWRLFGDLAVLAFLVLLTFATGLTVHMNRLRKRPSLPVSEGIGARATVLSKVRKHQALSPEELEFATRVIGDHRAPLAFCIPATVFFLGCFYVLGSLEQLHGATPSQRTFIGVLPMIGSLNITGQLLRVAMLKKHLPRAVDA